MLGERTYFAQETVHLLQGIPLVFCSMTFQREVNADNVEFNEDGKRLVTGELWLEVLRGSYMAKLMVLQNKGRYVLGE
jgi:hypothetical protein